MRTQMRSQRGFTLIELLVVVVILGILAAISISAYRGQSDGANAKSMEVLAKQLGKAVGVMHVQMGTGTNAVSNPITASGLTLLDVLVIGEDAVNANYKAAYRQAQMRPLEGDLRVITRPTGSTPGTYQLGTFPIAFVACETGKICVQYQNVPTVIASELFSRLGTGTFNEASAVSTGSVRYTAANQGFHTVTLPVIP